MAGHLLLMWRLLAHDVRRRPAEAVMFLVAVGVAMASLTLGTAAGDAVATGYATTRAATAGPDVMSSTTDPDPARLASRLARLPGVIATGGPFFAFDTTIAVHGSSAHAGVEGRDSARSAVDRPLVTSGSWVRPGGVVVERGFAKSLDVHLGDRVTIGGRRYPVVGTAISAATEVYPWGDPAQIGPADFGGVVWLTAADAHAAAGDAPAVHLIYLKLSDPASAWRFGRSAAARSLRTDDWLTYHTWQNALQTDRAMIEDTRPALVVGGWLLAVAATVTLVALATVRAARDNRRAALLRAVGAGPGTVLVVLLVPHLLLTVFATALGLAVGTLAAPRLVDPSAGMLDAVGAPGAGTVGAAFFLALVVALAGVIGPALRTLRTGTVDALADPAHLLTHHPHLNAVTAYLPMPLLLGIRLLARRPGRAALACAGTAATTVMVTALLTWHTELDRVPAYRRYGPVEVRTDRTGQVLLAVTLALVALSVLNALLMGWGSAVQARRSLTIARTLGATPGQVVTALCVAQLLPALPGVAAGIPAGLGLYWLFGTQTTPPATWLLTAGAATLLAVAALTALPAWAHTRRSAGGVLTAEPA
ncbi:putative ABC transport system permease protein [Actinacidiphila yanglinensis]|uniref:Putative ABC transport system permease protein n=1 Tax=Actinacidiphila yanglinensis TaxID=310779 RepID=A0A1H6D2Q7_9ACTN|nr:FtsX-like permease family protein [Actinacidiphila yanglinensis]SEG79567.1 putative ABC transport system permease protein [Actinacidiphila yanglinensis]